MKPVNATNVISYSTERVGDGVRAAFTYDEEDIKVEYLRDDIKDVYDKEALKHLVSTAREIQDIIFKSEIAKKTLGTPSAISYTFNNQFIVHLMPVPKEGIILSFEKDVASRHDEFVSDCVDHMYDEEEIVNKEEYEDVPRGYPSETGQ